MTDAQREALIARLAKHSHRQRAHAVSSGAFVKRLLRDGAALVTIYDHARTAARRAGIVADLRDAITAIRSELVAGIAPRAEREEWWRTLLGLEREPTAPQQIAAFLRVHAHSLRTGKPWDVPATIAAALENAARRLDELPAPPVPEGDIEAFACSHIQTLERAYAATDPAMREMGRIRVDAIRVFVAALRRATAGEQK